MVFDAATRERRVRQFEHYLGLMEHRALQLTKNDCFIIFSVTLLPKSPGAEEVCRFVQFACHQGGLYLELPNTTLTPTEAKRAMAKLPDLYFTKIDDENARAHKPVCADYQYHQSRKAAEDTAYFFFDLWHVPVDAWIEVKAFEGVGGGDDPEHWEDDFSMA